MSPFILGAVGWYGIALILIGPVDVSPERPAAVLQAKETPASCGRITDQNFLDCLSRGFSDTR